MVRNSRSVLAVALLAALALAARTGDASGAGTTRALEAARTAPAPPVGVTVARFSGHGARVLTIRVTVRAPLVVTATHAGSANFIVELVGRGRHDLLVNEIGSYAGQVAAEDVRPGRYRLPVDADGAWTIVVTRPVPGPSAKAVPAVFRGHGSRVLRIRARRALQPVVTAAHRGRSNFIVMLIGYGNLTGSTLLFNEIGRYRGQTLVDDMPTGSYLLAVEADGDWTIRFAR